MGIYSRYQPVDCDGVQKGLSVFLCAAGLLPEQFYDPLYSRPAIAFYLRVGWRPRAWHTGLFSSPDGVL